MQSLLKRARKLLTAPRDTFTLLKFLPDSRVLGGELTYLRTSQGKPLIRVFSLAPRTGKQTTQATFPFVDSAGGTEPVFAPDGSALLGITDDESGFIVHVLSIDGKRHHCWVLEKANPSISEVLHHATGPIWIDHGRAWAVLAFRHRGDEPTSELFVVTGRRTEPGKFRLLSLGRSDTGIEDCFHSDAFQGQYGFASFDLGDLLECPEGESIIGVRGTMQIGYRPQLFRYTFHFSDPARSRQATRIPFPPVGMFASTAYSPISKRLGFFAIQERDIKEIKKLGTRTIYELSVIGMDVSKRIELGMLSCYYSGPFPRQLQWLPDGKRLCFEFKGSFYVLDSE